MDKLRRVTAVGAQKRKEEKEKQRLQEEEERKIREIEELERIEDEAKMIADCILAAQIKGHRNVTLGYDSIDPHNRAILEADYMNVSENGVGRIRISW